MRNEYKSLIQTIERKRPFGKLSVAEGIFLNWLLEKKILMMWTDVMCSGWGPVVLYF
jgi:hypothetical protein